MQSGRLRAVLPSAGVTTNRRVTRSASARAQKVTASVITDVRPMRKYTGAASSCSVRRCGVARPRWRRAFGRGSLSGDTPGAQCGHGSTSRALRCILWEARRGTHDVALVGAQRRDNRPCTSRVSVVISRGASRAHSWLVSGTSRRSSTRQALFSTAALLDRPTGAEVLDAYHRPPADRPRELSRFIDLILEARITAGRWSRNRQSHADG